MASPNEIKRLKMNLRKSSDTVRISDRLQKKSKLVWIGLAATSFLLAACGTSNVSKSTGTSTTSGASTSHPLVAMLLPESTVPRFLTQDAPNFVKQMKLLYPSAKVIVEDANGSASTQLAQAQAVLTKGAKAILMSPVSSTASAAIVNDAHKDGVPVVEYSRLTTGAPVAAIVGTDPYSVGVALGKWIMSKTTTGNTIAVINGSPTDSFAHQEHNGFMSVLKPAFASGSRHEAGDVWTPGWLPSNAQSEMSAILTKTHNNIQGVVAPNDGTAEGIIAALSAQGLAGKVPITGVDAGINGDRLILKGLLGMSIWRSAKVQEHITATAITDLLKGKSLPKSMFTKTQNNGMLNVPWAPYPFYVITKSNMNLVLNAGVINKQALCKGIPAGTGPC